MRDTTCTCGTEDLPGDCRSLGCDPDCPTCGEVRDLRDLTLDEILATIAEATGHRAQVLHTGGGCQVLAWRSEAGFVCWLSDCDASLPTVADCYGLVLGIYEPDAGEPLWPSEAGCEGLRFYYGPDCAADSLAAVLVEAREDVR